ncbi:MAG: hypothetical protein CMN57_13410 [Gammaproteobacteria bacterium]|nr:hypothetical protein [Gammaproteobacteria bacterium]
MEEKRQHARKAVPAGVRVRDLNTGQELGTLLNLSPSGMMIFCEQPLPANAVYQCELELGAAARSSEPLRLGVESLWCQASEQPGAWWAGLRIIDIEPGHSASLERYLDEL